jgi:hypothetical protein
MDARIAEAMHSDLFKAGMDYLSKYTDKYVASNSVHINGVAGAGKTDVVLKKIRQRFNDEETLVLGPTKP